MLLIRLLAACAPKLPLLRRIALPSLRRNTSRRSIAAERVHSWDEVKALAEVKHLGRLRDCDNVVRLLEVVRAQGE